MPRISFQPSDVAIEVADGTNIRDAGIQAGVDIPSTCGGVGSCGLCKVKIGAGAEFLGDMTDLEIGKLGNVFFITKERLSCQTTVQGGDVACSIPDDTRAKAQKMEQRKAGFAARPPRPERTESNGPRDRGGFRGNRR